MEEIIIRQAVAEDLNTLLQFEQGVIAAERPFDPTLKADPINYYDLPTMLTAPHIHLVVAEYNKVIIASGYVRIEKAKDYSEHRAYGYLGFMYTEPAHRGKGINQKILTKLAAWSKTRDINELRLEVYRGNTTAIRAYEKVGFIPHMLEMRLGI